MTLHRIEYTIEPYGVSNYSLEFVGGPFNGIKFLLDKVSFEENNFKLKYTYDIIEDNGMKYKKQELEHAIGDLLMQLIEDGSKANSLVYTGGTDED